MYTNCCMCTIPDMHSHLNQLSPIDTPWSLRYELLGHAWNELLALSWMHHALLGMSCLLGPSRCFLGTNGVFHKHWVSALSWTLPQTICLRLMYELVVITKNILHVCNDCACNIYLAHFAQALQCLLCWSVHWHVVSARSCLLWASVSEHCHTLLQEAHTTMTWPLQSLVGPHHCKLPQHGLSSSRDAQFSILHHWSPSASWILRWYMPFGT